MNKRILFALALALALSFSAFAQETTFTRITTGAIVTDGGSSFGASWGDYDNDGDLDLFVANNGNNFLYQNNGNGTFTKITSGPIVTDGGNSSGSSWGDYDNDGDLDLFVANYNQNNFLYQNNGNGTFTKITSGPIVTDGGYSRGSSWGDYDNDGDLDLFVANFNRNNFLYQNNGDGTFTKITSGPIVTGGGYSEGSSWGDYDNDGDLDLFVANYNQNNFLYQNNGNGTFTKITSGPIVTDGGNSIGGSWGDCDNDGDLDLFVANDGENNFLYQNNGNGTFTKITSGPIVTDGGYSEGSSWGDYDNDGDLDLFVANYLGENNFLYQNNGNDNKWIDIRLLGTVSNKAAIGAKVKVKAAIKGPAQGGIWQMQELSGQTGYLSQNSLNAEFGLGDATMIDSIKVEWPSGIVQDTANVQVNQRLTLMEKIPAGFIQASFTADTTAGDPPLTVRFTDRSTALLPLTSWAWDFDNDGSVDSRIQNPTYTYIEIGVYSVKLTVSNGLKTATVIGTNFIVVNQFKKVTSGPIVTDGGYSYGGSWGDYDNDGDLDLFVAHYSNNFLYQNNGNGTFTKITSGPIVTDGGNSYGGSWGDYDNDGDLDLFVANSGNNFLYQNNGNGTFTKITSGPIVTDGGYSEGSSWGDYDNDGDLDLFVANFGSNFLYQNNGNGTFTRITSGPIVNDGGSSYSGSWGDYDNDGDLDLFVANIGNNFLYQNNGNGTFGKITSGPIVTDGGFSYGSSWGDYDNDGDLDLFVANANNQNNFLYQNNGDGTFGKITSGPIVNDGGGSWGSSWGDYDNDGDLDLFVANSGNNFLYQNNGNGTFTKITSGRIVNDGGSSEGGSWGDYDNDGDLDLFVANYSNNFLYQNNGNANNRIDIRLIGTVSNRSAIGAKVKVKAMIKGPAQGGIWQMQELSGQTGYGSQNSLNAEFGLDEAGIIDSIRIEWPSGIVQDTAKVQVNQRLTLREKISSDFIQANFTADTTAGDRPLTVRFTDRSTALPPPTSWAWDFDNDGSVDSRIQNPTHTYTEAGLYSVKLIVSNGLKADTLLRAEFILVNQFKKVTSGPIVTDGGYSEGSSWGDYDNDGDLDLFVANFGNNFLYQNNGNGTFTKITSGPIVTDGGSSYSGSWGDYDNDGDLDLFVANANNQNNFLYQNNGNGTFTKITSGRIVNDGGSSEGSSWGDYDNDGDLDLFVANYLGENNFLYQNNGNGTFGKITSGPIVTDGGDSWGSSWGDYDNDGDLDLFVANYNQNNFLYQNNGNGTFTKITSGPIVTDGGNSRGSSWGDYDNDGDLDLFVANYNQNNFLYQNNGNGTFTKITSGPIVTDGGNSIGSSWGDYDNDGDLDLFVANDSGNNFLYQNNGDGSFTKITSGPIVTDGGDSRGSSWGDYDNDGDLDLFVANTDQNNFLYQNNGNGNNWIDIRLAGTASNTAAIGTKVKVKAAIKGPAQGGIWQMQELSGQTGYLSQNSLNAEFGLGDATMIDSIRIEWPSGEVNMLTNVPVNQFMSVKENRHPRIKTQIVNIILSKATRHFIRDLDTVFVDLDNDTLTYLATSDNPRIATASISKSLFTVSLVSDTALGRAKITVVADDGKSNMEKMTFDINRPPFLRQAIPDTTIPIGRRFLKFDLPALFMDPERDPLTFMIGNSNESVAIALISEGSLFVFALNKGKTSITLAAEDGRGGKTELQFEVSTAISLAPVIVHDHGKIPSVKSGQAIWIEAEIQDDDDPVARPLLRYRPAGGTQPFIPVGMDTLPGLKNTFRDTIPGAAVTDRGVEYFIEATDIRGISTRHPKTGVFSVRVRVEEGVKNKRPQPSGDEQKSYHLFSIPLNVDKKSPADVLVDDLGPYNIKKWRFYDITTDTVTEEVRPIQFPNTAEMAPGKAFWLIIKEPNRFIDTDAGTTVLTSEPFAIALKKGWNFVGNPFNFPAFAEDTLSNGQPARLLAYEAGDWSDPFTPATRELQPFEGYAVYCSTASKIFINPNRFSSLGNSLPKTEILADENALWSIRIRAQCQEARDSNNLATIVQAASRDLDRIDQPEPPVIGEYVSVYFPHREWNTLAKTYCLDARPEPVEGEVWEFEVKTNIRDKVNLTFEGVDEVPKEFEVWLVDDALKITQNLREQWEYAVAGAEHPKQLKLVVGKRGFVDEKLAEASAIPATYELSQNFPNPFNPVTTIRYGLPKAERVTLKIYNLLGAEVALIINDELRTAGYHAAIWDGRNKNGKVAASGVYVYRLQAGSFVMTKKLALVK